MENKNQDMQKGNFKIQLTKVLAVKIGVGFIGAMAVILLFMSVINSSDSNKDVFTYISAYALDRIDGEDVYMGLVDGTMVELDGVDSEGNNSAFSHRKIFFEDQDLYVVDENGPVKIEEDVLDAYISMNGETVAYFTDEDDYVAELYVYDCNKGESELIEREAFYSSHNWINVVLSPDGNYIGYIGEVDMDDEEFVGFVGKVGDEAEELGKNEYPIALSKDADLIYSIKYDSKNSEEDLFVRRGKNDTKLISDLRYYDLFFNSDFSQLLFYKDGKTYLSVEGEDEMKIDGSELSPILDSEIIAIDRHESEIDYRVIGVSDFRNIFYEDDNYDVGYITEDGDFDAVVKKYDAYTAYDVQNGITFIDDEEIIHMSSVNKPDKLSVYEDPEEVREILTNANLSAVAFVTEDQELAFLKGKKSVIISEDEPDVAMFVGDTETIAYIMDEELFYSKKGGKSVEVDLEGEVQQLISYGDKILALVEADDENLIYVSINGTSYELVHRMER